jgi:hypothetical protein
MPEQARTANRLEGQEVTFAMIFGLDVVVKGESSLFGIFGNNPDAKVSFGISAP